MPCVQELQRLQQKPQAADANQQTDLSHALHAVGCQASIQPGRLAELEAQLISLQVCQHTTSMI